MRPAMLHSLCQCAPSVLRVLPCALWRMANARPFVQDYRRTRNITSTIMSSDEVFSSKPPFQTGDRMAFWQKSSRTG